LDYFDEKDFKIHLHQNECLTMSWGDVWKKLRDAGWRPSKFSSRGKSETCYQFPAALTVTEEHFPNSKGQLTPGIHSFYSKLALVQYIARFPYLLQPDKQFIETLKRFGWKVAKGSDMVDFGRKKWDTLSARFSFRSYSPFTFP
jgi:hypothetical protein